MKPQMIEGNLLDQHVDVIVNAWNRKILPWWLLLPQGISGAIKKRGGLARFERLISRGTLYLIVPLRDIRSIQTRIPGTRNEYMSPEYSHQQVISVSDDRDMETATQ